MGTKKDSILVSDLGCATAIICEGYPPIDLVKETNSSKVYFVFDELPVVAKVIDEYWKGLHVSNSRAYFDSLKMLKNRIYAMKDNAK